MAVGGRPHELTTQDTAAHGTNERILRAISSLYAGVAPTTADLFSPRTAKTPSAAAPSTPAAARPVRAQGLRTLSAQLGVPCSLPRRKLTVLLVGTHSAGKSSFVNYYAGEQIQTTGVAVETQGFALVTSGRRRETLGGPATLRLFEELAPLARLGAAHALRTEVSASRARSFPLVTLVDTPGLVDGGVEYPFKIEACIDELAAQADLVLVFFDPHMQASDRVLAVLDRLCAHARPKLRCFLSKADTVASSADRNKVLVQLARTLTSRTALHLRELPCLYIPHAGGEAGASAPPTPLPGPPPPPGGPQPEGPPPNHMRELCAEIDRAIEQTVQASLEKAKRDAAALERAALARLDDARAARALNGARARRALALLAASALPPLLLCAFALAQAGWLGRGDHFPIARRSAWRGPLPAGGGGARSVDVALVLCACTFALMQAGARLSWRRRELAAELDGPTLARLKEVVLWVRHEAEPQLDALYDLYLAQSVDNGEDGEDGDAGVATESLTSQ